MILALFTDLRLTGGLQRGSRHMAASMAKFAQQEGLSYLFLSLNDEMGEDRKIVADCSFRVTGFGRSKKAFLRASLDAVKHKPILIFVNHPNLAPIGWLVKQLTKAKMIVVGWGIDVWDPLPYLRRLALRHADIALAISNCTAQKIVQQQRVSPSKVKRLPLALDPAFWSAAQALSENALPSNFPDGRVVLSVTRLDAAERYKGVDTMIKALPYVIDKMADVQYVVIGDGDDRNRLEQLSHACEVEEHVHFLGKITEVRALVSCYQNCEVFALPSKGEGFGLVFLEAMACGKPTIGGAHGGTLDIIDDGVTGFLVPHGDVSRIAQVVERLLTNNGLYREIGKQGQERVRSLYLYDHFHEHLMDIVKNMLCSASCSPQYDNK